MDHSKIFDKKFADYLKQIGEISFSGKTKILGIQKRNQSYVFEFFNRQIVFDQNDFMDTSGDEISFAVKVVLCKYILMCPSTPVERSNKLVTFREFSNAGPLFSNFTENTGKILETTFSGHPGELKTRCLNLGGTLIENGSYDLSFRFRALPRVPIILNFNDTEDNLPSTAGFLYHDTANRYLDLECLSITATYLAGILIQGSLA